MVETHILYQLLRLEGAGHLLVMAAYSMALEEAMGAKAIVGRDMVAEAGAEPVDIAETGEMVSQKDTLASLDQEALAVLALHLPEGWVVAAAALGY